MTGPNSLTLNDGKAGMQGLDKERINRIIREASKGSKFFLHAEKKEKELKSKVDKMLEERKALTAQMIRQSEIELDGVLARLENTRDMSRDIVHVDMDAFYAAVEMRDNPALRDVPMAVGGSSMLSTSNYLARRYGVRAAMPGFIAKKLCPDLVIVPGNHDKYSVVSAQVMDVISKYTTEFSAASLDEVYCDMTELVKQRTVPRDQCSVHGHSATSPENNTFSGNNIESVIREGGGEDAGSIMSSGLCWCQREKVVWNLVEQLRSDIEKTTQLTASAGLSCNTFLAKVCSDLNKPNGQYLLTSDRETIMDFVAELEIKKVPGIGRVQQAYLSALSINKVSDLISARGTLAHLFTPGTVQFYLATALGLGSNQVCSEGEGRCKSMSTENTFSDTDVNDENNKLSPQICEMLSELAETLARRLKAENLAGETVSIKLKLATFEILQRSRTQSHAVSSKKDIEFIARELLSQLMREKLGDKPPGYRLSARLLGVRVHKFVTSSKQSSLLSFTGNNNSSSKTWNCPVCGVPLPAQLVSFNKHVDTCILNGDNTLKSNCDEAEDTDSTEMAGIVEQTPSTEERHEVAVLDNKNSDEISPVPFLEESESEMRGKKRKSSEEVSNDERWSCPVCNKLIAPDLATFNLHIDRCLVKGQPSNALDDCSTAKKQKTEIEGATKFNNKQSLFKYFKRA